MPTRINEDIDRHFREAVRCDTCFEGQSGIQRSGIDIAQPRWIGRGYVTAVPKVLILAINPGSGGKRADYANADGPFTRLLKGYRDNRTDIDAVFDHQRRDMPNWGRFIPFHIGRFGLRLDNIAMANIAWCGTEKDRYPSWMLSNCFEKYTGRLLLLLEPNLVLLAGVAAHKYGSAVQRLLPAAKVEQVLHFSHRKGRAAEDNDVARVRAVINDLTFLFDPHRLTA